MVQSEVVNPANAQLNVLTAAPWILLIKNKILASLYWRGNYNIHRLEHKMNCFFPSQSNNFHFIKMALCNVTSTIKPIQSI